MKRWRKISLAAVACAAAVCASVRPTVAQSLPETVEAIDKARVTTRILFITAHPDDEWSSLLTYLSRGLDADVGLLTITRGQGGQNAIGPEQGEALGVIRTEELLAAGKHYGVRQFFTRAPDTGYVKTPQQALKIWGDVALEDMVRVIRTYRPDVVINGWGGVRGGHGHHQESGILTPQAVAAAADVKKYPGQIQEGLPPWKVKLLVRVARSGEAGAVPLPINDVSPLWGKSYVEMGMEGHAQHRSQGTPAFFGNPFFRRPVSLITENEKGDVGGSFDKKLLEQPLASLAEFPGSRIPLASALSSADAHLVEARKSVLALDRRGAARSLAAAGKEINRICGEVLSNGGPASAALIWELDHVKDRIDRALVEDIALPVEVNADQHELVAGEEFSVTVNVTGPAAAPVKWTLDKSSIVVPAGWSVTPGETKEGANYNFKVAIPPGAKAPSSPGDVILPFPPPLVKLSIGMKIEDYSFALQEPVRSMEAKTSGIQTYGLNLVPAVTLTVEPQQVMVPEAKAGEPVRLLARVRYHRTNPAKVAVGLDAADGWSAKPIAPLDFAGAGDQLVRFVVSPASKAAPGAYPLHPYVKLGEEIFRTSLEPIPTLVTRDSSEPAEATIHVLDLVVPARLRVGYIAAENDPIPEILRQIGIQTDLLDEVALAFGDLGRYDAIVVGIRAYELRPDLPRSNARLLDYVQRGGSLVVQYQRDFAWNDLVPSPYPAKMPEATSRVTDANSPVEFLAPENPVLLRPNRITLADFQGWVQERGLYFWGTFDPRYQPVLGLKDPGEPEAKGGLVYAMYGQGVYIYTGLSFFRELPAGVPGAYRLFVNLLSQTRHILSEN